MKKIFLFAGAALSFAACTSEDIVNDVASPAVKGITFEASNPTSMVETRGELSKDLDFFWFAERDRLDIYASGDLKKGYDPSTGSWTGTIPVIPAKAAEYKATKSEAQGYFTAIDDENVLMWDNTVDNPKANFIGTYGVTSIDLVTSDVDGHINNATFSIPTNATQSVKFNEVKAPMYAISNGATPTEGYQSVGEKIGLRPARFYPMLRVSSHDDNAKFAKQLGELKSIDVKLVVKGAGEDGWAAPYSVAGQTIVQRKVDHKDVAENTYNVTSNEDKIHVDISGTSSADPVWKASDYIYVNILPVEAVLKKTGEKDVNSPLILTIGYNFANVTLTKEITQNTPSNWNIPHSVNKAPELNVPVDFPYIITNANELLVFSGNFDDIYKEGDKTKIKWNGTFVAVDDITSVYSAVNMTAGDLRTLSAYSSAVGFELAEVTTIPEGTFWKDGSNVNKITDLKLPKVTEYNDKSTFALLKNLDLASFEFATESVVAQFFNNTTKDQLQTINISAVENMNSNWLYYRTLSFKDYDKLTAVTLGNVILSEEAFCDCDALVTVTSSGKLDMSYGVTPFTDCESLETVTATSIDLTNTPDAFKGCRRLKTVEGVVDLTKAESAFEMCQALETVNVATTEIPANAFRNAYKIKNVLHNGSQIKPTSVGEGAFFVNDDFMTPTYPKGALTYMDLSDAKTIGTNAFRNTGLKADSAPAAGGLYVLTVGAEALVNGILQGTDVEYVEFTSAVTVQDNPMYGVGTSLKQIKFLKPFTAVGGAQTGWYETFGTDPSVVDLFVDKTQGYYSGKVLTLPANAADATNGIEGKSAASFIFKSIKVNR